MVGVYIHIPKTAGMSICKALNVTKYRNRRSLRRDLGYSGIVTFGHELLPWLQRRKLAPPPENTFAFTFCRNPYDRAVSLWLFNNKRNETHYTFSEFCLNWGNWGWRTRWPQSRWVEKVDLGFLGRFENLQEDFNRLCEILGVERQRPLPHINRTEHEPYQRYYTPVTRAIVRAQYARDFDRFGYDPNDCILD